jgi:DNA-binding protein HU-beta
MTKADLIEKVAKDASLTKADAGRALESGMDVVVKTLKKGEKVTLVGFGTFSVPRGKPGQEGIQ